MVLSLKLSISRKSTLAQFPLSVVFVFCKYMYCIIADLILNKSLGRQPTPMCGKNLCKHYKKKGPKPTEKYGRK